MSDVAKWYVIHTYSGYENKVAQNIEKAVESRQLHDLVQEVRVPVQVVEEIKDGKKRKIERKLFPSYVIVKMVLTDDSWYVVRNIRGVTGFVGPSSKPVPLTRKEVDALGVEKRQVETDYNVGDSVKIISGSLEGFVGDVTAIDTNKGIVTVTVSILGRNTPVEVELNQVVCNE